jgi:predicted nucleotidyltransferase
MESEMARNGDDILKTLEANREALRCLKRLGLFGSAARGEARSGSDLDFVVEFEHKSFDAYMDVKLFLERLFACDVDLVLSDSIKPRLRPAILKEARYAPGF